MPIQANTRTYLVLAAILGVLALATVITVRQHPTHAITHPSRIQIIELQMNLSAGQTPAIRSESARKLGEIAISGLKEPGPVSVQELNSQLQVALERESDPATRTTIQAVLSEIRKNEILRGAASPLKQNFK